MHGESVCGGICLCKSSCKKIREIQSGGGGGWWEILSTSQSKDRSKPKR